MAKGGPARFGELFTEMTHMITYLVCEVAPPRFDHVFSWLDDRGKLPPNMTGATKVGNEGGSIPSMSCIGSSPHIFVAAAQSYCRVLERC